jgi:hypothetical protein
MSDGLKHLPPDPLGTEENPRRVIDTAPAGPRFWWKLAPADPKVLSEDGRTSPESYDVANCAFAMLDSLSAEQQTLRWWLALNAAMYHGGSVESYAYNYGASPLSMWAGGDIDLVTHNIVKSAVDTVVARISMNKPKATAVSVNGTWEDRLKCEGMTDFAAGVFDQIDMYAKLPMFVRDACLSGDGILKVHEENGKLRGTRVLRGHIIIDECEGYQGDPRTIFERRWASKERLMAMYPEAAAAIRDTPQSMDWDYFRPAVMSPYSNVIEYVHAYRLPDLPGAPDDRGKGRHIIFTRQGVLVDEEYNREDFPYIRLAWSPPTTGYWSESFVAAMRGGQIKVNQHDMNIYETMRRMNAGRWLVASGSDVVVQHLNNAIGSIVRYTGQRPIKDNSDSVPPEEINERNYEIQVQPMLNGISTLASSGQVPNNLRSGEGEKVAIDIHTQRFTPLEQRQGFFVCDAAQAYIDLVRSMKMPTLSGVAGGADYTVWVKDRFEQTREIKFGQVDLNNEAFRIRISATNMMADDPADRTDQAISLSQAGVLDGLELVDAINFPDLQSITAGKTAALKMIKWLVYKMARDEDFYLAPEADFDLAHGIPYFKAARAQLFMDGAPSSLRNKFLTWINQAMALVPAPLGNKPMPMPMNPGGPPLGAPMPPPQSQMLPFAGAQAH